jgi:phosphohistidine phosphatase
MEILLVRHAIAEARDSERWPDDDERPLAPKGIARARKAAQGLLRLAGRPERMLTSPLVRTRQTAALLAQHAGWPAAVDFLELAPGKTPQAALGRLRREPGPLVALVGHEPGLGELIALALLGEARPGAFEMKRFAAALVSFPGAPRAGRGTLRWLVPPRLLRATS